MSAEFQAELRERAAREQKATTAVATGTKTVTAPAANAVTAPDSRTALEQYHAEDGTGMNPGRPARFNGKDGFFFMADDDSRIDENTDWVALVDQIAIGRIRFNGEGQAPDVVQGLLYEGYRRPPRESLGDNDESQWPVGLSGDHEDPWRDTVALVLQRADTGELATFTTMSKTGRAAVEALVRHYDRLQKTHPDVYPIVRLKLGGFQSRYGWTHKPVFAIVGKHPKNSAAQPDSSLSADMNDALPLFD